MQYIFIDGNLTKDAETKSNAKGNEYTFMTVACNEQRGEKKETTFYDVYYRSAPNLLQYLKKGQQVFIRGELAIRENEKDGRTYTNINVYADALDLGAFPKKDQA